MKMRKLILWLASAPLIFGQTDSNSLTITASRNLSVQPDQAVFVVNVTSDLSADLNGVVAALAGLGVTAANFSSVYTTYIPVNSRLGLLSQLEWTFTLPVPFSKVKDTIASLIALQEKITGVTFSAQGTQVSPELQASQQCPIPDLIADARAQAQKLANAAGATVGPILALSDGSSGAISAPATLSWNTTFSIIGYLFGQATPPSTCTLVVKFSLLHSQ